MAKGKLDPILAAARALPQRALESDDLPLPNAQTLECETEWTMLPEEERDRFIGEAAAVPNHGEAVRALFLMWTWESEPRLRQQIVTSFPLETGSDAVSALELICLHEAPDSTGNDVIKTAKDRLEAIAKSEPRAAPLRTRGAVQTIGTAAARRTAAEALARIAEVEANRNHVRVR